MYTHFRLILTTEKREFAEKNISCFTQHALHTEAPHKHTTLGGNEIAVHEREKRFFHLFIFKDKSLFKGIII